MNRFHSKLLEFCWIPNYEASINFLAELADSEPWDFSDSKEAKHSILKNYLEHTFRKVQSESKVFFTADNNWACFNTGLVTANLESIFAIAERNSRKDADSKGFPPYVFKAFVRESDYQLISKFADRLPDVADFFQKPEDLIFNPQCKVVPQIDHIISDNKERFPSHMQGLSADEMRRRLIGAINEAQKKVKSNYKIAVPQYYDGKIQLLLPLCLTPGSPNPDLALVTHKIGSNTYTARTCLTLKMAYNNARLIVKPQSSWLKP